MTRGFTLKHTRLRENDIEQACVELVRWRGYYVIRLQCGKFKTADGRWITIGEPGIPDYVALHHRYPAFFLEVKRPGAGLSEQQEQKVWELRTGYQLAVVAVDSANALNGWIDQHEAQARGP